jgi:hypothetical protein
VDSTTHEWAFNVAVDTVAKDAKTGQVQQVDSFEFTVPEDNVAFFASGWFSYLALGLSAAAFSRDQAKRLAKGLGLQSLINVLCLGAYVYINGYGVVINTPGNTDPRVWLLKYLYHLIYLVVPFAGPFGVALLVHPEWRGCINLPGFSAPSVPRAENPRPPRKRR